MKNISLTETIILITAAGSLICLPTVSQPLKIAQLPTKLSGVVIKFSSPPADSSVKLLDNILSKVRGLPQIAVYKPTLMALSRDNAQAPAEEPSITDFRLAIEPRQDSMRAQERNRIASSVTFELKKDSDSGTRSLSLAKSSAPSLALGTGQTAKRQVEEWRGKAKNESARFYRARKELELDEAQSMKAESWKGGKLDDGVTTAASGSVSNAAGSAGGSYDQSLASPASLQKPLLGGTTVAGNLRAGDKKLAFLPPNVAMGIPLLRLGSAQSQIAKNLEPLGKVKKETIKGWTIWSYNRGAGKSTGCRLQVFTRGGIVQAIRVFDPEFASADLGIQNGDTLTEVKERYGQPAFILAEPSNSTCQNYVYPLSQVAFLLSRPAPDREPQVVCQFIFNLK